ncbi:MAG: DUF1992 domain-containing protein [Acidimicrobiia bacterium]
MPTERVFESLVDRQIREAAERGEFDNLSGSGEPIEDLSTVYDPDWWAKRYFEREKARDRADELRQAIRAELPRLKVMSDRAAAAIRVEALNEMVHAVNEHLASDDRVPSITL